jgi:preprotein translocase subunit SecF
MRFPIIPRSKMFIIVGVIFSILWFLSFFANLRYSIQFTGGMEITIKNDVDNTTLKTAMTDAIQQAGFAKAQVSVGKKNNYDTILVQTELVGDEQVSKLSTTIQDTLKQKSFITTTDDILEQSVIWPSLGEFVKNSAIKAIVIGLIIMAVYILFAFSGMRTIISPATLGLITILTMLFDLAVPMGVYGLMMKFNGAVQVDSIFIIALLTIIGYSINDTIIIFDRVRENVKNHEWEIEKGTLSLEQVYEDSLRQTMRRSLGTSAINLLIVITMMFYGAGTLQLFAIVLAVGIFTGTYSSIFLAAPAAFMFSKYKKIEESL